MHLISSFFNCLFCCYSSKTETYFNLLRHYFLKIMHFCFVYNVHVFPICIFFHRFKHDFQNPVSRDITVPPCFIKATLSRYNDFNVIQKTIQILVVKHALRLHENNIDRIVLEIVYCNDRFKVLINNQKTD